MRKSSSKARSTKPRSTESGVDLTSSGLSALSPHLREKIRRLPKMPAGLMDLHEAHKVGDLVFTASRGGKSLATKAGQTAADLRLASFSHVAICFAPALLVEAIPKDKQHEGGVQVCRVEEDDECQFHHYPEHRFRAMRLDLNDAERKRVRDAILYYLGEAYNFRFLLKPRHTSGTAFCSQFVIQVLAHAGIKLKGIADAHMATPSAVFRAARAAGALDVSDLYRNTADRIESDPRLRDALAQDGVRKAALLRAKISLDLASQARPLYDDVRSSIAKQSDIDGQMEQLLNRILGGVMQARQLDPSAPPRTLNWEAMREAIVRMRQVLAESSHSPEKLTWETGSWQSEHMPPLEVGDVKPRLRTLVSLVSVATICSDKMGKLRDRLVAERETIGRFSADIANAPADRLPVARSFVTDNSALLFAHFEKFGYLAGLLDQPWQDRPAQYPPKVAALAKSLQDKLDQLEANLRGLWTALLALLDEYASLDTLIGGRLKAMAGQQKETGTA